MLDCKWVWIHIIKQMLNNIIDVNLLNLNYLKVKLKMLKYLNGLWKNFHST